MAKADKAREELGWLKVVFAVSAAIDASLLSFSRSLLRVY
jgi:hypothetical protein